MQFFRNLFGFSLGSKVPTQHLSFAPREDEDGAMVVPATGGHFGTTIDLDMNARTDNELVSKYRDLALQAELDIAVDEIINECIVKEGNEQICTLNLDDLGVSDKIKDAFRQEFENIQIVLNFNNEAYNIFKRWYIDGRIYYHVIIDEKSPNEGIKELRYVDPRKIKKIRVVKKERDQGIVSNVTTQEFFLYTDKGFKSGSGAYAQSGDNQGVQISPDSILYVPSGVVDKDNKQVLSHLHKAIKPLNQLRMLEDALIIYFLARSPERRIFYLDVAGMPKIKADQYMKEMQTRYKNKLVYDSNTGEIRDDRKYMTMLEDFWLPRRDGGKSTEILPLAGGQQLPQQLESVNYYRQKLYQALNVPISRLDNNDGFNLGRAAEINREELKFQKFINRLRLQFSHLLLGALEKQLILKGVIAAEEWPMFVNKIRIKFNADNFFAELKDAEILRERLNSLALIEPYLGRFYSDEWVCKNVLYMTEEDVKQNRAQIQADLAANPMAYPALMAIQAQQETLMMQATEPAQPAEAPRLKTNSH